MDLLGKGMFIWMIPRCEKGDAVAIAEVSQQAQLTHVLIKIADTMYPYNIYNGVDVVPPVVQALQARNIAVWGWHYVKGDNPVGEANRAIDRVRSLNLQGYVINAEIEYKEPGKTRAAARFMERLRSGLPNTPIALSSYRFPSYHPQLPWREFLEGCDYNMPQVYWMRAHNAGYQLQRSVREFSAMTPSRPIVPTGAAFKEHGWLPSAAEVLDFLKTARSLNLDAVNFYSWDSSRTYLPQVWKTISDFSWPVEESQGDISTHYIATMNTRDPDKVITLYNDNAVHITHNRTIQGYTPIKKWFQSLFSQILPEATFTLVNYTGTENFRHLNWTAASSKGKVENGHDTLGLMNGKIKYHYSFFRVTN